MLKKVRSKNHQGKFFQVCCLIFIFGFSQKASAIPVQVAWAIPLNPQQRYILQITDDPGFGRFLIDRPVDGNGFTWDTPGEGVFHWRLIRPNKVGPKVEGSTFVSGSFVAVEGGSRQKPARISWKATPGADRYKLYLVEANGRARTMVSTATSFTLPPLNTSVMVEVVPFSGGLRTTREYHFQPTLSFTGEKSGENLAGASAPIARPASKPSEPPKKSSSLDLSKDSEIPASSQDVSGPIAAEPIPSQTQNPGAPVAALPSETQSPQIGREPSSAPSQAVQRRRHLVYGMAFYEEDQLDFSKLEVELSSYEGLIGVGGGFWLNPFSALVLSGFGAYHEHRAVMTQEERFPGEKIFLDQARYTAMLDLGLNLLAPFDTDSHVLGLAFSTGGTQFPALPLQLSADNPSSPNFETRAFNILGGTAFYGWLSNFMALNLQATFGQAREEDVKLYEGRIVLDFYPSERFALLLGAHGRKVAAVLCDPDPVQCLAEGKVRTDTQEMGGFLGIGAVFM